MALGQAILALPVVPDQIVGTPGHDTLTGTSMADTLDGGGDSIRFLNHSLTDLNANAFTFA